MPRTTLRKYWPLAIIILLALLFFYQLAFTDLILARGDSHAYFYPYWGARDAALSNGELPLWTPELFMGAPLLANPQLGTLYPPNWLTITANPPHAVRISVLIHIVWATLGAYALARRTVQLDSGPALLAGILFGLGGYVGAHVEQINQLQALSWMPWLFLLFDRGLARPWRYIPLLGAVWALQLLAGHTQVVFITGVGLGVYGLYMGFVHDSGTDVEAVREAPPPKTSPAWRRITILLVLLAIAATVAVILALPQLLPTQELIALSNRGGGLNQHEATAFSLNPLLLGRGLLPSYDGQPFTEYIGYLGVIGLGLVVLGILSQDKRKRVWTVLAIIGLLLAFGRHNPIYMEMARLPGFNLFRVPARWLALFALGGAMLGGLGVQSLVSAKKQTSTFAARYAPAIATTIVVALLAANSLLSDRATEEIYGAQNPTASTFFAWGVALAAFLGLYWWQLRKLTIRSWQIRPWQILALLVVVELWLASSKLPFNDLVDPDVYNDARFTIRQMQVYGEDQTPPGRLLGISDFLFFPGDEAVLEARWERMGLRDRAVEHAFTAMKRQETVVANMPLAWEIPSIDGFGGGVLPTEYYTAFTSLLLPEGTLRTVDGRLREVLAQSQCRGACIPDNHWLDLTNTQYLLTDKVYDRVHEGIFYDTQFRFPVQPWEVYLLDNIPPFESTSLHILYNGDVLPRVTVRDEAYNHFAFTPVNGEEPIVDGYKLARLTIEEVTTPAAIEFRLEADAEIDIRALTLVDDRTGDFVQLAPWGWLRIYSADVKIYQNLDVMPRAFVVHAAVIAPDNWWGTELALEMLRDPAFDPSKVITINSDSQAVVEYPIGRHDWFDAEPTATITEYDATRIVVEVDAEGPGYLLLTDAYYPAWEATVNGEPAEIYRADVMFRAVPIAAGHSTVIFEYKNTMFELGLAIAVTFGLVGAAIWWRKGWRRDAAA